MVTEHSRLRKAAAMLADRAPRAFDESRVVTATKAAARHVSTSVRNSWLYGWLTAEPEPEVIVIDLRETRTVGPFIAILDQVIDTLAPYYQQSRLKHSVDTLAALATRAADTRPGRLLVALFEPPEPPAERDEPSNDRAGERDDE